MQNNTNKPSEPRSAELQAIGRRMARLVPGYVGVLAHSEIVYMTPTEADMDEFVRRAQVNDHRTLAQCRRDGRLWAFLPGVRCRVLTAPRARPVPLPTGGVGTMFVVQVEIVDGKDDGGTGWVGAEFVD